MAALHDLNQSALDDGGCVKRVDALACEADRALGHLAALGAEQVRNCLQGGRFAGTVAAQQGHDAARRHLERDALQHQDDVVVNDLDIVD